MLNFIFKGDFAEMSNCPKCGRMHVKGEDCTGNPETYAGLEGEKLAELYRIRKCQQSQVKRVQQVDLEMMRMRF